MAQMGETSGGLEGHVHVYGPRAGALNETTRAAFGACRYRELDVS